MPSKTKKPEKPVGQKIEMRVSYLLTISLPVGAKNTPTGDRVAKAIKKDIREYGLEDIIGEATASEIIVVPR